MNYSENIKKYYQSTKTATILLCLLFSTMAQCQDIRIELARKKISMGELMQIKILSNNEELKLTDDFPEIPSFEKSYQVALEYTNQQGKISKGIEQNYKPLQEGTFQIPAFEIRFNNKKYGFAGESVVVIADKDNPLIESKGEDLLSQFEGKAKEQTIGIGRLQNAFVALTASRNEIYVGQEVNLIFAFYLAEDSPASLELYQLNKQLGKIIKQIHLPKSWEEDYKLDTVWKDKIQLGKKTYQRYKFYQSSFFPSESGKITIPTLELQMEDKEMEKIVVFRSNPLSIMVKPLPKKSFGISVGSFQWQEYITYLKITTGQTVNYQINIVGNGNFSNLELPKPLNNASLEFYTPVIEQTLRKTPSQLIGSKSFRYTILARNPGKYPLKNYFTLVYFNTETKKYDTLSSRLVLEVSGEPVENLSVENNEAYQNIQMADGTLQKRGLNTRIRLIASIILGVLMCWIVLKLLVKGT